MNKKQNTLYIWYLHYIQALSIHSTTAVLEIAAIHWPFSDQFQHLADQNPFWLAKFTVNF